ncbi:MAG TPA: MFS transporter [Chloroflexia bacterium]|nr:MFS transporter [Chloroflexia bacterium]
MSLPTSPLPEENAGGLSAIETRISSGSGPALPVESSFSSRLNFMLALYWFAISFLWGGFLSVVLPALNKPLATSIFGPDFLETARGIMTGIGLVIAMFVQPLAGAISDRSTNLMGRRRPFMIVGTLGIFVSLAIVAIAGNWWVLLLGYVLLQFTDNISQGAYQGLMPDVVPESKRGRASAALAISQLVGTLAGATVPGILQGLFGEITGSQLDLLLVAIVFTVCLTLTCTFIKEQPYRSEVKVSPLQAGLSMFKGVRRYPDFVMLMFARFIFLTAPATVSLFVKSFIENKGFVRPTLNENGQLVAQAGATLSIILGIVILMAILAAYPFSLLSERIGRKNTIYVATLVGFIGGVGLLIPQLMMASAVDTASALKGFEAQQAYLDTVRPLAIGLSVAFGACVGASWGAFMSVDWAFATDLIPLSEAGRFMGLSNLATAGCQALAALIGGIVVDSPLGYTGLFISVGVYYLLSAVLLSRVREKRGELSTVATFDPA